MFPPKIQKNEYMCQIIFDDNIKPYTKRILPSNLMLSNLEYLSDFHESFTLRVLKYLNNELEIK